MVHHANVAHILTHGMYARGSANFDPSYKDIGHPTIIGNRVVKPIPFARYGNIGEYVPFYFCGRTPMLLNIKTGYGVEQLPQNDIIFLCCPVSQLVACKQQWVFTDGNASVLTTEFYTDLAHIGEVDWNVIGSSDFSGSAGSDRKRQKCAEFLVRSHVPANCISHIVCLSRSRRVEMQEMVQANGLNIDIGIDTKNTFYFP